jgi:NAD(P)-dependent dehydrogenase (short-subunit alcohol dehydrogenase family)
LLKDAKKLKNKVVLITGSGDLEGFGGKLALEAAHYGAKVVVSDSSEQGVAAVVEEIQQRGGCVVFLFSSFLLLRTHSLLDTELLPAFLATSQTTLNS